MFCLTGQVGFRCLRIGTESEMGAFSCAWSESRAVSLLLNLVEMCVRSGVIWKRLTRSVIVAYFFERCWCVGKYQGELRSSDIRSSARCQYEPSTPADPLLTKDNRASKAVPEHCNGTYQ